MVKIKIEPGTAIRDNPGTVKNFSARMGLPFVVVKKDTRRAVQLTDNDPLGTVNDKSTIVGHQGDLTEVDLLLLDVTNRLNSGFFIDIPGDQTNTNLDW